MQIILRKALVHAENKLRLIITNCLFNTTNMKDTNFGVLLQQTYRTLRRLYAHNHFFIETIHLEITDSRMRNKHNRPFIFPLLEEIDMLEIG